MAGQRLHDDEQGSGHQQHRPAGVDRRRQREREGGGDERADVGHKAQDRGEDAPEHRARHADEEQADADHQAEGGVEGQLRQEQLAQTSCGIVEGRGGLLEVV
jgi:hypothetical protein